MAVVIVVAPEAIVVALARATEVEPDLVELAARVTATSLATPDGTAKVKVVDVTAVTTRAPLSADGIRPATVTVSPTARLCAADVVIVVAPSATTEALTILADVDLRTISL